MSGERVSDRVEDEILRMIATGELAPGQRLPGERQLAESMGVSRVSVRAALQALKTRGLLAAVQGGGTRVVLTDENLSPPLAQLGEANLENLHDLAEIRRVLESWAAGRAAANATPEQLNELEAILRDMERNSRRGQHKAEDDVRFHLAIARATGSAVYMHIVGVIRDALARMLDYHRYELFPSPADDRMTLDQHRAILAAIRDRAPVAATAAMDRHLDWVCAHYAERRARRAAAPESPAS